MAYRPPWQKIARTPMVTLLTQLTVFCSRSSEMWNRWKYTLGFLEININNKVKMSG